MKKLFVCWMLLVMLCGMVLPAQALVTSKNPLIDPQPVSYVETEDEFYNILICGIDYGNYAGKWASGNKRVVEECHTDVIMLASINKTKGSLNLVSIPRDSVTYVPGIKGIYKLNAAFNCAEDMYTGMRHTCEAVSWYLGGIPVHNYIAVDMASLIAMGDAIGGVDFEVDMSFWGLNKKIYRKGMQHLDGEGIMEYVRARKNATKEANDVGRTRRGRDMMIAVFDKVQQLILKEGAGSILLRLVNIMFGGDYNVLTNLTRADLLTLTTMITRLQGGEGIGSYVLTGRTLREFEHWNFTFIDQEHRLTVLKEAFGIEAETIPYISRGHATWLVDHGFDVAKTIMVARDIYEYCAGRETLTKEQKELLTLFEQRYEATVQAFDQAADSHQHADNRVMEDAWTKLKRTAADAAEMFEYPQAYRWTAYSLWYKDAYINEYNTINWN